MKNEKVAVAVCQWISHALFRATSRRHAKSSHLQLCHL